MPSCNPLALVHQASPSPKHVRSLHQEHLARLLQGFELRSPHGSGIVRRAQAVGVRRRNDERGSHKLPQQWELDTLLVGQIQFHEEKAQSDQFHGFQNAQRYRVNRDYS